MQPLRLPRQRSIDEVHLTEPQTVKISLGGLAGSAMSFAYSRALLGERGQVVRCHSRFSGTGNFCALVLHNDQLQQCRPNGVRLE